MTSVAMAGRHGYPIATEVISSLPDHSWFVGVQFHPEFKTKPMQPHPLFRDFVAAAIEYAGRGR
jgi:CTP synthase (UTP-ammonia lyase)